MLTVDHRNLMAQVVAGAIAVAIFVAGPGPVESGPGQPSACYSAPRSAAKRCNILAEGEVVGVNCHRFGNLLRVRVLVSGVGNIDVGNLTLAALATCPQLHSRWVVIADCSRPIIFLPR